MYSLIESGRFLRDCNFSEFDVIPEMWTFAITMKKIEAGKYLKMAQ
jgi:hypothetical protein